MNEWMQEWVNYLNTSLYLLMYHKKYSGKQAGQWRIPSLPDLKNTRTCLSSLHVSQIRGFGFNMFLSPTDRSSSLSITSRIFSAWLRTQAREPNSAFTAACLDSPSCSESIPIVFHLWTNRGMLKMCISEWYSSMGKKSENFHQNLYRISPNLNILLRLKISVP